jgi:hypothetical protein
MAMDTWLDGTDNWNTPGDWSAGLPDASSDVMINYPGNPEITASFGTVNSITESATLTFIDAGASSVTASVTNYGALYLDASSGDGGSLLRIGGALTNEPGSMIDVGPSDGTLSAASTIEAASFANLVSKTAQIATIDLFGSSTAEATLDFDSAAGFYTAGGLSGTVNLSGDALIEFASGQITTIAVDSTLSLNGSHAFVADASNTRSNSALHGLNTVQWKLDLENGASVTTSGGLTNDGWITLDGASGDGSSLLHINGTLTNSGTIQIGPSDDTLSARSRVESANVYNWGTINLFGGQAVNVNGTLHTSGEFNTNGQVNLIHDVDTLLGPITGGGDFGLSQDSKLEFGSSVSSYNTVTFRDGVDKLVLDSPSSFFATIGHFSHGGDSVLAKGFDESATTFLYTQTGAHSCSWTLTDATHTAVLNFAGAPYIESDFSIVAAKGTGYSVIKFV